jgi:hypothetical protein
MTENTVGTFDREFCIFLEFHLTEAFFNSRRSRFDPDLWCDGILMPNVDSMVTKKSVNDSRKIVTGAYTGEGGQTLYAMTIKFGRKSLSRYARDLRLEECVPSADSLDWVTIDTEMRTIELRLK